VKASHEGWPNQAAVVAFFHGDEKGEEMRQLCWKIMITILMGGLMVNISPARALDPGEVMLEQPEPKPGAQEKKDEAPTTCGPIISDTCLPIETGKASLQFLWAYSVAGGNFTSNWRRVGAKGDFSTFSMPVKFTYGPAKDLEIYAIVPYIHNFAGQVGPSLTGPNGERSASYGGVGDITLVAKYVLLSETEIMPAITGVAGVGFPSGHAHHLNPGLLGQDAVGAGAFTFTTGLNLFKWLKPFLVHSNIWLNTPVNLFNSRDDAVRSRESVTFNLAVEYPLSKRWVALLEFYSTWTWTSISTPQGFQSPATLVGVLPAIEFFLTEKWAASAGAAIDLFGKAGSYKYTPMFTVYYNF
jgi:Putative MetA-pathway of phenol degradation